LASLLRKVFTEDNRQNACSLLTQKLSVHIFKASFQNGIFRKKKHDAYPREQQGCFQKALALRYVPKMAQKGNQELLGIKRSTATAKLVF
jgi:hypothetical protein